MTNCTCGHSPWSYTDPEPTPDEDCPAHGDPAILRTQDEDIVEPIAAKNTAMTRDLDRVLDVEAGLAEVLATAPAEDTQRAAATINTEK